MTRRAFFGQVVAFVVALVGFANRGHTTEPTATTFVDSSTWPVNQWTGGTVTVASSSDWRGRWHVNNYIVTGLDWDSKTITFDLGTAN